MKISEIFFLLLALIIIPIISGCKNDENTPVGDKGTVTFNIANEVGGSPLQMGSLNYTNAAGNNYQVDLLKYYVSNFTLVKDDNTEYTIGNHDLIDATDPASANIIAKDVPNGTYTKLRFILGIDSVYNHTGDQAGDLDPINGMIWSWNTGYIFFKHEGVYKDSLQQTKGLLYHYGTDKARTTIELTMQPLIISGNSKKVNLAFDLNSLYNTPNQLDFNVFNVHQSTSPGDVIWIQKLILMLTPYLAVLFRSSRRP